MKAARLKAQVLNLPIVGDVIRNIYYKLYPFSGSEAYWKQRYATGGNSGDGSFGRLATFKAEVLNAFVAENGVSTVIEFGCGDGNQLRLAEYPQYHGFDVSDAAIKRCVEIFSDDPTKKFGLLKDYSGEKAEVTLSLDVIYHLVEDEIFDEYMNLLFSAAQRYVVIYSSNQNMQDVVGALHVRHRAFSDWVADRAKDWVLLRRIPNKFPFDGDPRDTSHSDFYIYQRA